MARVSHSGSCEHGCGDQCSRRKFKLSHLVYPLYMKSHVPVFERHFCGFAPEPSLASRVMTRAIAPREGYVIFIVWFLDCGLASRERRLSCVGTVHVRLQYRLKPES